MEKKDYFIIGLGILGWTWGIIQFRLNRKYQKSDKALDKRFEVYSNFMNQMDEMSLSMRNNNIYVKQKYSFFQFSNLPKQRNVSGQAKATKMNNQNYKHTK